MTHMWAMVVEAETVEKDGMVDVVEFQEVLEGSSPLVFECLNFVNLGRGDVDGLS
jgi:hypothetical protein